MIIQEELLISFRKQITNLYKDEYHYIFPDNFNILLSIPTTVGVSSKYRLFNEWRI